MKLISLSGPHGAGKDTLIKEALAYFDRKQPGLVQKALYITTRPRRDDEVEGRDVLFTKLASFQKMIQNNEFAYFAQVNDYWVGISKRELEKAGNLVTNISVEGALKLKQIYHGDIFLIYLDAPIEQRKDRLLLRNKGVTPVYIENKLAHDPSLRPKEGFGEFDLYLENFDGQFNLTQEKFVKICKNFYNI